MLRRENYYRPEDLLNLPWSYKASIIIFSMTAFVVHIFLTYRIYRLTDCNKVIGGSIVLLTLASWALRICATVSLTGLGTLAKAESLKLLLAFWLSKSNSVINRLVQAATQTGFLVTMFTLTSLILYLKYPTSHYYGILGLPAGRVYSTSIMDSLPVRHSLREKVRGGRTPTSVVWELGGLGWLPAPAQGSAELRFPMMAIESYIPML
ncbi:hypothetical protein DXG01_014417 [Tephrocybe rancida]|nr:hypothetical protein DXG01_014417 [Tephrocybe rancida]